MNIEKILTFSIIFIPSFWFAYLTLNNQVYGVDAWYWLKWGFKKPALANLVSFLFWLSIIFLFTFVKGKKRSPYFIASLFLLNFFSVRFLEVELDDYLMYLLAFSAMVFLKNYNLHMLAGSAMMAFYIYLHCQSLPCPMMGELTVYTELRKSPVVFLLFIPTAYLLIVNKKIGPLIFLAVISTIFMSGKFSNALPLVVFPIYLDFLTDEEFKFSEKFLLYLLILSLSAFLILPIIQVNENNRAFEKYCDPETKICNNTEAGSWHFGHYFAWKGYISNNPSHYGVCTCVANRCLTREIRC